MSTREAQRASIKTKGNEIGPLPKSQLFNIFGVNSGNPIIYEKVTSSADLKGFSNAKQ